MDYHFDHLPVRRGTDSLKWQRYGAALPLWVADMDFTAPQPVLTALHQRIDHGIFGYGAPPDTLTETLCARMADLYQWTVTPEQIVYLPGLVCGLNIACRAVGEPGDAVLVQTPIYPPFLSAPLYQDRQLITAELTVENRNGRLFYTFDDAVFAKAISPETRLFILCHPHNPVGRSFSIDELSRLADICEQHDLVICSDEIHCDLLLDGQRHSPFATLSPEIAQRCITLMAPSKTFNIAGLGASFAIIQNPELRQRFKHAMRGIVPDVNVIALTAALAAYQHGSDWLQQLLPYLATNREVLMNYVDQHLPGIHITKPEATYLAWLDCREAGIAGNPHEFFIQNAGVAMNDGATFGPSSEGFIRLNFGCPRATLLDGLERMRVALTAQ
ncbi:MAG: PatB family C-S lyase [Candidatus Contendobacter sp.]|jgi:cystathionine beta-lyase|nr:PatB family C-S lyase [Gammaproteobacteria bacterium]MCC8994063.1 PatB family C-S lyase [Candidatus Contendobacter sp.]